MFGASATDRGIRSIANKWTFAPRYRMARTRIDAETRVILITAIEKTSLQSLAKRLDLSAITLARLAGGLTVNDGSVAIARERLAQLGGEKDVAR